MDIEQLKLILAILEKAGDGAYIIAVLHFLYPYFSCVAIFLGILILALLAKRAIVRCIDSDADAQAFRDMAKVLGIEPKHLGFGEIDTAKRRSDVLCAVSKLVGKQ